METLASATRAGSVNWVRRRSGVRHGKRAQDQPTAGAILLVDVSLFGRCAVRLMPPRHKGALNMSVVWCSVVDELCLALHEKCTCSRRPCHKTKLASKVASPCKHEPHLGRLWKRLIFDDRAIPQGEHRRGSDDSKPVVRHQPPPGRTVVTFCGDGLIFFCDFFPTKDNP